MHSFHQSRGRIAFEVLCSLTVSASCAGAWVQTGATAFLPAALVVGLYGLWHLTDMQRASEPVPATTFAPEPAEEVQHEVVSRLEAIEPAPLAAIATEEPSKPIKRSRKKKQPDAPAPVEPIVTAEPEVRPEFPDREAIEEELHPPIAPLFEAKPFVQQQRPTFGRKAG